MYPESAIWEINNSSASGLDLLAQELAVGVSEVFYTLYYSSNEKRVKTISSTQTKKSAVKAAVERASTEIRKYQQYEKRNDGEILVSATLIDFSENGSEIHPVIEIVNKTGEKTEFSFTI